MNWTSYTDEELEEINEGVWTHPPVPGQKKTSAPCPCCGADTRILIAWSGADTGCGAAVLIINCDGCDRRGRVRPAKSRCPDFDDDQMQEMVEADLRGQAVYCPTCQTPLDVQQRHTLGARHYFAYCYRGGAIGQFGKPQPGWD